MTRRAKEPTPEDLHKKAVKKTPEYQKLQDLRSKVEEKFYWSRHDPARSEQARKTRTLRYEKLWNRVREKQSKMLGEQWTYKHDRRDNWTVEKRDVRPGRYDVHVTGQYPDPKTTIVWRKHTGYGKRREAEVRNQVVGGSGYAPGHIAPASGGADPEGVNAGKATRDINGLKPQDRLNYTRQNPRMNNERGHKDAELGIAAMRARGQELNVSYKVKINSKGSYPREFHREFEVRDAKQGNKLNVKVGNNKEIIPGNYIIMNPAVDHGGPHTKNPQKPPAAAAKAKSPTTGHRAKADADRAGSSSSFFSKDRAAAKAGGGGKTSVDKAQVKTTARAQTPKASSRTGSGPRFRIR
jgi:hypothetical protein